MRNVLARTVLALVFLALLFVIVTKTGTTLGAECGAVTAGTDSVPADIIAICESGAK